MSPPDPPVSVWLADAPDRERVRERIRVAARVLSAGAIATPALFLDGSALRSNLTRWQKHFPAVPAFYAVKANIDPLVLRELFTGGANADVASAYEIAICRALGLPGERMILSNPRKDFETIRAMADAAIWATTVDSEEEIDKLTAEGIPSATYNPVLFVRIKVPTEGVAQDLSSKFGIRILPQTATIAADAASLRYHLDGVRAVLKKARGAGFVRFGLAFHVGTQCTEARVYESALAIVQHVAAALRREGFAVDHLDLGGGFPDARTAAKQNPSASGDPREGMFRVVGAAAARAVRAGYRVIAEPGRYLVADAGFLVTRVSFDRSTDLTGRRVQIDDGIYRTLSGRIHDGREYQFHAFRLLADKPPFLGVVTTVTVWGCSCDSFDKVSDGVLLPADIQVGDDLLAEGLGAYSTSFGSNTNGFAPATVVLYRADGDRLDWEVSPMAEQNALMLRHIGRWAKGGTA